VNIGDRQKGRLRAETVIDCPADSTRISKAIEDALRRGKGPPSSPYGDGRSSERLVAILKETDWRTGMTRKTFYHAEPLSNA
jgi:UDP-N-acetylglucosamine 2-epimerase